MQSLKAEINEANMLLKLMMYSFYKDLESNDYVMIDARLSVDGLRLEELL